MTQTLTLLPGRPPRAAARRAAAVRRPVWQLLLPGVPALGVLLAWTADDAGYQPVLWYPGALVLAAAAAATWLGLGAARRPLAPAARLALGALAAYVAWSYLSILWAADQGAALTGSNRALAYLLAFAVCLRLDWSRRRLEAGVAAWLLGAGTIALAVLIELARHPAARLFLDGQLAAPLGYHNGTAALGTMTAFGALALGSRRDLAPWLRGALAAVAVTGLELGLLAQSRGWLYTLPVIALVALALAPSRLRLLGWSALPAGATLATLPWVAHAYAALAGPARELAAARAELPAARAALVAAALTALLAAGIALLDRRFAVAAPVERGLRRAALAVAAGAVLGLAVGGGVLVADGAAARAVHAFTADAPVQAGQSRFLQLGSGRYDFWRAGVDSFAGHPLLGLGQDNFAQAYVAARRTREEPSWIHSLELRLLVHTGIVGALLFALFAGGVLWAFASAVRARGPRTRALLGAALLPGVVWTVHGSVDWLWELPALSGAVFALAGAGCALAPPAAGERPGRPWAARVRPPLVLAAAGAAAFALLPAALGEHALARARTLAPTQPAAALGQLRRARSLEPLSSAPDVLAGALELNAGRPSAALSWLRQARARDPRNWLIWVELALADGATGRPAAERAALSRATRLDPREPVIAAARRRAGTAHPLTIAQAAARFGARMKARLGR